ncbi:MAG: family transporter, partial [Patescibacteria group bacterium]|nr:family transporter [Patescibacteria group bacterium]
MLGIIFGLIASLGQGLGYALIKRSYTELPSSIAFALSTCFGILIWVPFGLVSGVDFSSLSSVFGVALLSALLAEAYTFYVFSKGELSLTSAVFTTYPLFTMFFSITFLGESLTTVAFIAAIITTIGVLITSFPEKLTRDGIKSKLYLLWPLSGAIAVGLSDTISKGVIDRTDAATFLFALAFAQIPVALLFLKMDSFTLS